MIGPRLGIRPIESGARFVRLRVSVRYPPATGDETLHSQWFWRGEEVAWREERSLSMGIRQLGVPHVYWTFIPSLQAGESIEGLRFDPVDGRVNAAIQWIALDLVR